ncbi:unnamed protein product [Closterium sp. NIES-65]|nr:unnamed protein product [Closterium sp. NIES-65]
MSQVDPVEPVEVAVDSGAPRGAASGGAEPAGAGPGGARHECAEPGGAEPEDAKSEGAEPGGAKPESAEPGGAEHERAERRGDEHGALHGDERGLLGAGASGVVLLEPMGLPLEALALEVLQAQELLEVLEPLVPEVLEPLVPEVLVLEVLELLELELVLELELLEVLEPLVPKLLELVVLQALELETLELEVLALGVLVLSELVLEALCGRDRTSFHCFSSLDYASSLVAQFESVCPPSVGGECALRTDVIEDRQADFECSSAAVPHLVSMLIALEGDPDAQDTLTPRSYAEAIENPYSSQWHSAMDAEIAFWKSTCTYADEIPPPGANIVSGMWIFMVKRPPGSSPVFKACYVAQVFSQRQGVDFFQTFFPTPKMATLQVPTQASGGQSTVSARRRASGTTQ